jgi:hypothetical protein
MFKIKVRITEKINELTIVTINDFNKAWNNVCGFIEVRIGEHKLGCYYHDNPLAAGEYGSELVNWWLEMFLLCATHILKTQYAAFHEPEKINRWLEFSLNDDEIIFNLAIDEKCALSNLFINEKYNDFIYVEPIGYKIKVNDFLNEVSSATKIFLNELESINPELMKTSMAQAIISLSNMIRK